jgi:hypothetical protein
MAPQAAGSASKPQTSIAALNAGSTYITTFHVYHNMHPQLLPEIRRVPPCVQHDPMSFATLATQRNHASTSLVHI